MIRAMLGRVTRYSHARGVSPLRHHCGSAQVESKGPAELNPPAADRLGLAKESSVQGLPWRVGVPMNVSMTGFSGLY